MGRSLGRGLHGGSSRARRRALVRVCAGPAVVHAGTTVAAAVAATVAAIAGDVAAALGGVAGVAAGGLNGARLADDERGGRFRRLAALSDLLE